VVYQRWLETGWNVYNIKTKTKVYLHQNKSFDRLFW